MIVLCKLTVPDNVNLFPALGIFTGFIMIKGRVPGKLTACEHDFAPFL